MRESYLPSETDMYHNELSANQIERNNGDIYIHCQTPPMYKIESLEPDYRKLIIFSANPVFMEDNSPTHNSYRALIWLQEAEAADHPACAPDLNPIEHVWRYFVANLASFPSGPAAVNKRIAEY